MGGKREAHGNQDKHREFADLLAKGGYERRPLEGKNLREG